MGRVLGFGGFRKFGEGRASGFRVRVLWFVNLAGGGGGVVGFRVKGGCGV